MNRMNVPFSDLARPGLMISQTWPESRRCEGQTLQAVEIALAEDFFRALQTVEVPYSQERKKIASVVRTHGVSLTYCLARVLNENGLNLSSLDEQLRRKSVDGVILCLDHAREIEAKFVQLLSGPRPERLEDRPKALVQLQRSLLKICESAISEPGLELIIEPLDIGVHKRGTLGLASEAVQLVDALRTEKHHLHLCLDTAHLILNGEDPLTVLELACGSTAELHFCNCVTESAHPLYGDHHIRFGPPGVLGGPEIAAVIEAALRGNFFFRPSEKPSVYCEVLKRPEDDSVELMRYCRRTLDSAWAKAQSDSTR